MLKIILVGEKGLDETVICRCNKICPDAPAIIAEPVRWENNGGMAQNVFNNLKSLNPDLDIHFIHQQNIITKTRYIEEKSGQVLLRVDQSDKIPPSDKFILDYLDYYNHYETNDVSAIILSDYGKGFTTERDVEQIVKFAKRFNCPVFMDTKKILGLWSKDVQFVKINELEYENNLKVNRYPEEFCENLIITRGEKDTLWKRRLDKSTQYFKIEKVFVADLAGCGDCAISGLVVEYLRSKDISKAINYGSKVASLAATKRGVVAISYTEII